MVQFYVAGFYFCISTIQVSPKEYLAELEKIGINAKAKNFLVFQVLYLM